MGVWCVFRAGGGWSCPGFGAASRSAAVQASEDLYPGCQPGELLQGVSRARWSANPDAGAQLDDRGGVVQPGLPIDPLDRSRPPSMAQVDVERHRGDAGDQVAGECLGVMDLALTPAGEVAKRREGAMALVSCARVTPKPSPRGSGLSPSSIPPIWSLPRCLGSPRRLNYFPDRTLRIVRKNN